MTNTTIDVEGMHCKACEMLVKEDIGDMDGVKSVFADHEKGLVRIEHNGRLDLEKAKKIINELGYKAK